MNHTRLRFAAVAVALTLLTPAFSACAAPADPGQIGLAVGSLLERSHYARRNLDDDVSQRFLHTYLKNLDYSKLFFLQSDIDLFTKEYGNRLDEKVKYEDMDPAFEIFDVYKKRVEDRIAKVHTLLDEGKFDFSTEETIELNREKSPWPKDEADADRIWKARIENEIVSARLSEVKSADSPQKIVSRRYDRMLRATKEMDKDAVVEAYLNALALTYDPHSEYMGQAALENFSINMKLSLVGIGAMLRSGDDGYAKIVELIPGGPAALSGKLKTGDRISGVAQGKQEFTDVVDMKLDKVVELIRGTKGTTVRLDIIPASASDPSARKVVEIVRDEVKLTDQEAKAEVIEHQGIDGKTQKLGWITLPSFYADMDHPRSKGAKSTTRDVRALLERLTREGIDGLVMDLRRNGGGSLDEAVNLTGLFIKEGPVVQAKRFDGQIDVYNDEDPTVTYSGPMVVLISKQSASASEIFAAALQDYGRALIVGDKNSFGKGTVQTMLEIGRYMSPFNLKQAEAGALKLTVQKFYRVAGGSTQLKGVSSDVVLPSRLDNLDIGESALDGPLAYDEVKPKPYDKWSQGISNLTELRDKSADRITKNKEFSYIREDNARLKQKIDSNKITLNEEARRAEIAEDKKRKEAREAERDSHKTTPPNTWEVKLSDVDKPELTKVNYQEPKKKKSDAAEEDDAAEEMDPSTSDLAYKDPVRVEALDILSDLVDFSKRPKTANVSQPKAVE